MKQNTKIILTIAGSDCSSGGGMQADLRTIHALKAYGVSAITAIAAQNTMAVNKIVPTNPDMLINQITTIFDDFKIDGIKVGLVFNSQNINIIANLLKKVAHKIPIVLDPSLVTKSHFRLIDFSAIELLVTKLFPLADVITPNKREAEILTNIEITNLESAKSAAKKLIKMKANTVLIKGIKDSNNSNDLYYDGKKFKLFKTKIVASYNDYGAGCTLSSGITTFLAQGKDITNAIGLTKTYLTTALNSSIDISHGHGRGPINHFVPWSESIECEIEDK